MSLIYLQICNKEMAVAETPDVPDTPPCTKISGPAHFKNKVRKMNSFIDTLDDKENIKINGALINHFISSNIHFDIVESSSFRTFVETIRPAYKPPNALELSELLDKAFDTFLKSEVIYTEYYGVLLINGTSDYSNEAIISVIQNRKGDYSCIKVLDFNQTMENFIIE